MKTSVRFNKISQQWEARDGNGFFFAAANRRKVLLRALQHDTPQLYKITHQMCLAVSSDANGKNIPLKFVDRLLNATQLIQAEKIDLPAMQVQSQRSNTQYQIAFDGIPKQWFCTCPDFANGGYPSIAYGPVCEHVLAVMLLRFLGTTRLVGTVVDLRS